jgi:hypothetical protein
MLMLDNRLPNFGVPDCVAAAADGEVDRQLARTDEEEEDEVEDDVKTKRKVFPRKVAPCDGERQTDACLAVERPVPSAGKERDCR